MQTVTPRFLSVLRISHTVAFDATIIPASGANAAIPLLDGSITMDRTASTRRSGSLTTLSSDPALTADVRAFPQGAYVDLRRGILYGDRTREVVPLGYLRCESVSVAAEDGTAQVELADRMAQVDDTVFSRPWSAAGMNPTDAIVQLVRDVFPGITANVTPQATPTALTDTTYEDSRASAVADIATAIGYETFFNATGDLVVRPLPTIDSANPVWTIDAGRTGVLVSVTDATDRTETINGVLVRGQARASSPPVSALTVDNSTGPFRWGGPFGKVLRVVDSSVVANVKQAKDTGAAILASQLGLGRTLTLAAVPNPALVPGDTVAVVFPSGATEYHMIDAITIPLTPTDAIGLTTRSLFGVTTRATSYVGADVAAQLRGAEVAA